MKVELRNHWSNSLLIIWGLHNEQYFILNETKTKDWDKNIIEFQMQKLNESLNWMTEILFYAILLISL
jgi:hypothetical protein